MLLRQKQEEAPLPPVDSTEAGEEDKANTILPVENGQGDTLPLSSGILQVSSPQMLSRLKFWARIHVCTRFSAACSELSKFPKLPAACCE